ncbi:thiosulfate utilization sulfurtransferase TsuB/YeeD [Kluyvera sp. NPDC087067]|uniref:thiosulfate utilization sulfurtransferase TsuB/YeeD n=1 Tax=unclassified Kluyvera TaxID=2619995 RepID=UPI0014132F53
MVVKKLDVVTQVCPFPLIEAKAAMAELAHGDQLVIEFDCTQATEAIPQWAAEEGFTVTDYQQSGDAAWTITVQK